MRTSWLWICVVAACGSEATEAPDAAVDAVLPDGAGPLGCLGETRGAAAPDPIALEGKVFAVVDYQVSAVEGATVELRDGGGLIAAATTDAEGAFTMTAASGGHPLEAWFAIATAGRLPTIAYPGDPLIGGENAFLLVADSVEVAAWYTDAGATYAPGMRTVIASVKDCANDSPAGVTAVVSPAARVTYYDEPAQRWDPALAASTNGFVLIGDSAARFTMTPSIGATPLPARTIEAAADTLTLTLATPRAP